MCALLLLAGCAAPATNPSAGVTEPTTAVQVPPASVTDTADIPDVTTTVTTSLAAPATPEPPTAEPPTAEPMTAEPPTADPLISASAPTGVRVPSIGVDEQLIDLSLSPDGTAEVPQDYDRAGWYTPGGRPGGVGPTVILGHVDSTTGPAVFFRLREVAVGDDIELTTADGGTARYTVTSVESYGKDAFPTFEVFGATLDDVVRLVTCGGAFDRSAGSYLDNLVVTAERRE